MPIISQINPWEAIALLALIQSIVILIAAWISKEMIRLKSRGVDRNYQLFDCANYSLRDDLECPDHCLVLAELDADGIILNETFCTRFGSRKYIEYQHGQKVYDSGIHIVPSYVAVSFCIPGLIGMAILQIGKAIIFIASVLIRTDYSIGVEFRYSIFLSFGVPLLSTTILILFSPFFEGPKIS